MALYELDGVRVEVPSNGAFWVAGNATVIGRVRLEEDVSIWFNTVVRGDTEPILIGARSNVQDNCLLHNDPGFPTILGRECTIGHMACLHGCVIGDRSLIGIGATVLNGARIGEDCLIGAHALIPEGKQIPDRSVVFGSPGKIARQVTDQELARIREGIEFYASRWKQYARSLRPQA